MSLTGLLWTPAELKDRAADSELLLHQTCSLWPLAMISSPDAQLEWLGQVMTEQDPVVIGKGNRSQEGGPIVICPTGAGPASVPLAGSQGKERDADSHPWPNFRH